MKLALLIIALGFEVWMVGPTAWDYVRLKQSGVPGEAQVVERSTVPVGTHGGRRTRIVYDVQVDGKDYRRVEEGVSEAQMHSVAGLVPVVYLPSNPTVATISLSELGNRVMFYGLILPGIIALAWGISQFETGAKRVFHRIAPQPAKAELPGPTLDQDSGWSQEGL